jgi:hypothetical protein
MQTMKSAFGVIRALVPVLYCGGLLYYFLDVGSVHDLATNGLGPTVLGLGVVGLLFCIPLILKIARLFRGPGSPGSKGGPDAPADSSDSGFDADAAIARYMAWRSTEADPGPLATPPAQESSRPAARPSFGRKASPSRGL